MCTPEETIAGNARLEIRKVSIPKGFPVHWFKKPSEESKQHLKPLHIEAIINGFPIARVLVDNGAVINVLPIATFKRLQLNESGLVSTDITVCGFNGGSSACLGVIPITLQIGTKVKETVFFVVDVVTTFNALLGRDWLHKVGAIPSTLH